MPFFTVFLWGNKERLCFFVSLVLTLYLECYSRYNDCNNLVKRGAAVHRLLTLNNSRNVLSNGMCFFVTLIILSPSCSLIADINLSCS